MSDAVNRMLLAPTTIRLFGRVLRGITPGVPPGGIPPQYLGTSPLASAMSQPNVVLAHILAYSYIGNYTPLQVPALFLVHGQGESVFIGAGADRSVDPGRFGLAHLDASITLANDLRFWTYDQSDQTIRLDPASGTLQQLVVDAETGGPHGRRRIDLVGQDSSFSGRFGGGNH